MSEDSDDVWGCLDYFINGYRGRITQYYVRLFDYYLKVMWSLSAGNFVKVKSMCNDPTRCVI